MHEALRRRILRKLETLPEARLYQVVDYIEFLESRYSEGSSEETSSLQKLAERLEDGLRGRTVSPSRLREAFQLISAADRVLSSISEAGREIFSDLGDGGADGDPKGSGEAGRDDAEAGPGPAAAPAPRRREG